MKRILISMLAVFLSAALALTACGSPAETPSVTAEPQATEAAEREATPEPVGEEPPEPANAEPEEFRFSEELTIFNDADILELEALLKAMLSMYFGGGEFYPYDEAPITDDYLIGLIYHYANMNLSHLAGVYDGISEGEFDTFVYMTAGEWDNIFQIAFGPGFSLDGHDLTGNPNVIVDEEGGFYVSLGDPLPVEVTFADKMIVDMPEGSRPLTVHATVAYPFHYSYVEMEESAPEVAGTLEVYVGVSDRGDTLPNGVYLQTFDIVDGVNESNASLNAAVEDIRETLRLAGETRYLEADIGQATEIDGRAYIPVTLSADNETVGVYMFDPETRNVYIEEQAG